jgi:2-polyprenyl-6-methoxyphenol hydroxylase-like FAD-dependent oxidoreductase
MSQGSAMAIEDAIVLADTLAGASDGAGIPAMLAVYRTRRAGSLRFMLEQNRRRDQARHLPAFIRRVVFRTSRRESSEPITRTCSPGR